MDRRRGGGGTEGGRRAAGGMLMSRPIAPPHTDASTHERVGGASRGPWALFLEDPHTHFHAQTT